jgi:hypothetical protein
VTNRIGGGIFRAKHEKYPHGYPLSWQFPENPQLC